MKIEDFRKTSLDKRREFYEKEFSVYRLKKWFKMNRMRLPQICALDVGTESGIALNPKLRGNLLYFPFSETDKQIKNYLPEDLYYDRNYYSSPSINLRRLNFGNWKRQELVFDIDVDNLNLKRKQKGICYKNLKLCFLYALKMKKELKKDFKKIIIVYSGRGFHLHVLDERAYKLSISERNRLTKRFEKYPIDPWVSRGFISLIRMPYSLNSLVSRKVIPFKEKFIEERTLPKFMKN